jgi:MFS family permease
MDSASSRQGAQATRRVVVLLAVAVFINYFDRGNLATASPLLKAQLGLSSAQMGILFSAFFWSYAPLQPVAGWLAQRYDVRYVLGTGLALWATATALTGCVSSFAALLLLRVLLGIGESVSYPCNAKFLSQQLGVDKRSGANGLIAVGQALGPTCGTLLGGVLMASYGWRATFVVFGVLSLCWLVPWSRATRGGVTATLASNSVPISYRELLATRSLWGTSLGHFSGNYAYYFTLTWMPLLLVKVHGFTMSQMAFIGAGVYGAQAVSAQASGWACDRWIRGGAPPERVWKGVMTAGLCGVATAMAVCAFAGANLSIALLLLAGVCFGMQSAPLGAITQTLGGARGAAQWMGIQNLCANLAGVLAPLLTGFIVEASGEFVWAFVAAALVTLLGVAAYLVVIGRVVPVAWRSSPSPA